MKKLIVIALLVLVSFTGSLHGSRRHGSYRSNTYQRRYDIAIRRARYHENLAAYFNRQADEWSRRARYHEYTR